MLKITWSSIATAVFGGLVFIAQASIETTQGVVPPMIQQEEVERFPTFSSASEEKRYQLLVYGGGTGTYSGNRKIRWILAVDRDEPLLHVFVDVRMTDADLELNRDAVMAHFHRVRIFKSGDGILYTVLYPRVESCTVESVQDYSCNFTTLSQELLGKLSALSVFTEVVVEWTATTDVTPEK